MSLLDPQWKYFTAEETRKPDYLAKRFAQIRRQLNEQAVAQKTPDEEVLLKVRKHPYRGIRSLVIALKYLPLA